MIRHIYEYACAFIFHMELILLATILTIIWNPTYAATLDPPAHTPENCVPMDHGLFFCPDLITGKSRFTSGDLGIYTGSKYDAVEQVHAPLDWERRGRGRTVVWDNTTTVELTPPDWPTYWLCCSTTTIVVGGPPPTSVPIPAAGWLLLAALGGLFGWSWYYHNKEQRNE